MKKMLGVFLMSLVLLSVPVFSETIHLDREAKEVETIIINDRKLVSLTQLGTMLGMKIGY